MIKRLWYSLLSNDKPQDKNVIWIDTSNSESFTLKLYRNGGWKPLQVVGTSRDMIERELTGYVTSHYHSYDRIINKPTTLEGYGITDCFNKKEVEKLLDNKVTKVDGMSLTSNNFSDKYKKILDNLSTSYYNKKNVDNLLNEKQDVISDLESIREGAKKGSTALQSFTETDPIYLKDKPFIALKSDLLNDNNLVHKEGDEDIKGAKWFEHIRTNNFGIYQEDNNNHSVYIDYHYDESNYLPILHFSSEEDWLTILDNIADPVYDFHAANKNYVDTKISTTEENLVHKDGFERITGRKQFQNGISVGLFNSLVANEDGVESGAWLNQEENPAPFIVADPSADDHAATKLYVDEGLATKQDTLTPGNGISIEGGVISSTVDSLITPITYAELVALRDSSSLVAGMQYRITDYDFTTTETDTDSAHQLFDIIVTADSESVLNENARAVHHQYETSEETLTGAIKLYKTDMNGYADEVDTGDYFLLVGTVEVNGVTYYRYDKYEEGANTGRYILLESIDLDSLGVGLDNPLYPVGEGTYGEDGSYVSHSEDAIVSYENGTVTVSSVLPLSNRDIASWELKYTLENIKHSSSDGKGTILWMKDEFRNECNYDFINALFKVYEITACAKSPSLVGTYAIKIINTPITYGTNSKLVSTFGSNNHDNIIKYDGLAKIVLGNNCSNNTFGNDCSSNTFGNRCDSNTFGNFCSNNTFGNDCDSNTFGNDCYNNTFGNDCSSNTFGNDCDSNTFGNNFFSNTFGNRCDSNTFGNDCYSNTFGNDCYYIKFATSSSATTKYNYYWHNHFGDGCQYMLFKGAETASPSAQVQNYNFAQGVQGTLSAYITIDGVRSRAYETKVAKNSSGELKIYCEADLIQ